MNSELFIAAYIFPKLLHICEVKDFHISCILLVMIPHLEQGAFDFSKEGKEKEEK